MKDAVMLIAFVWLRKSVLHGRISTFWSRSQPYAVSRWRRLIVIILHHHTSR